MDSISPALRTGTRVQILKQSHVCGSQMRSQLLFGIEVVVLLMQPIRPMKTLALLGDWPRSDILTHRRRRNPRIKDFSQYKLAANGVSYSLGLLRRSDSSRSRDRSRGEMGCMKSYVFSPQHSEAFSFSRRHFARQGFSPQPSCFRDDFLALKAFVLLLSYNAYQRIKKREEMKGRGCLAFSIYWLPVVSLEKGGFRDPS